jgi:hypothetical protein
MVNSFMLLLDFARSPRKDRSNPCLIIHTSDAENDENVAAGGDEKVEHEIPSVLNEDISSFRAQGFAVDNDDHSNFEWQWR